MILSSRPSFDFNTTSVDTSGIVIMREMLFETMLNITDDQAAGQIKIILALLDAAILLGDD